MDILIGFSVLFSDPLAVAAVVAGAVLGVMVGAIPGLTAAAAIAMFVPLTFYVPPLVALTFLYVIGKAGRFGGSISAILFNIPGTAASAATTLDGHPMVQKGQAGKALKTASVASVIGDFCGDLILIVGIAWIASQTEKLGPPEFFAAYMMAFLVIGTTVADSPVKGMISTFLGVLLGTAGLDPMAATPRFTFGLTELEGGFSLVSLLVGVFVFAEVIDQVARPNRARRSWVEDGVREGEADANRLSRQDLRRILPVSLRSAGIGAGIGLVPGLGSAVACFVAYGFEKRRAKNREEWGTGIVEGIAAPESANNAVSGPSMVPLLALGIPGSTIAAILVGVFTIHGVTVDPPSCGRIATSSTRSSPPGW